MIFLNIIKANMNMKSVIDMIRHDYTLDTLGQIKCSENPLIMWGIGDFSDHLFDYLVKKGVNIDAFWVDNKQCDKYREIDVLSLEEIIDRYQVFDVIVGHSRYDLVSLRCDSVAQIKNVFMFSCIAYDFDSPVTYDELCSYRNRFDEIYSRLEDSRSKEALVAYLNSVITCDPKYIMDFSSTYMNYFNNDVISIGESESILDIGAYDGDTLKLFLRECNGKFNNYYAFEPDKKNYKNLINYVNSEQNEKIQCYDIAAWNCSESLCFSEKEQGSGITLNDDKSYIVRADRIDNVLMNQPVSFIKINITAGAAEALEGCEMLIKCNKPKISVGVECGVEELLQVLECFMTHYKEYKLHLRFVSPVACRFVLYAVNR